MPSLSVLALGTFDDMMSFDLYSKCSLGWRTLRPLCLYREVEV